MSDMLLEPLAESSCDLRVIDSAKHSSFFCAIAVFYVPCMLSRAIIEQVFAALADRFRRSAEGMQ